jgi:hypothetical protein
MSHLPRMRANNFCEDAARALAQGASAGVISVDRRHDEPRRDGNRPPQEMVQSPDGTLVVASLLRGKHVSEEIQLDIEYAPEPVFQSGTPGYRFARGRACILCELRPG